jgi:hypothetical protein
MKNILFFFAAIVLTSFTGKYQPTPFQQLSKLAGGVWVMHTKKGTLCEEWKIANNTLLTGRSYKAEGKDTIILEKVELSRQGVEVYYTPTVADQNGGNPVRFKLESADENGFIFSNPGHDFPQRVAYQIVSNDSLHAWIDGKSNGKEMRRDFYYKRVR